jgi:hypothetical protein
MCTDWLGHVEPSVQHNILLVLQTLSRLQDHNDPLFIIIGALPLLIRGYLHYRAFWDVDLLFPHRSTIGQFIAQPKGPSVKIIHYDDNIVNNNNISSLHTAWRFTKVWTNVDYIYRPNLYTYYTNTSADLRRFMSTFSIDNKTYTIDLSMAYPWDIFIEKVLSPRTKRDVELLVDMSVDLKHIFAIYTAEQNNKRFYEYILNKVTQLTSTQTFTALLNRILCTAPRLGYNNISISQTARDLLGLDMTSTSPENSV